MRYWIEYADGRCCNFANSRKDLLDWLKLLKDEKIVDIRKIYKSGVTDSVIDSYRTDIDKFLGTKSSAMVTDSTDEDLYTYKSDYSSTTELLDSIEDLGERMSEEGTVL